MNYLPKSIRPLGAAVKMALCSRCEGVGRIHSSSGCYGYSHTICPVCNGTGKVLADQKKVEREHPLISIIDIVNLEKFYGCDMTLGKLKETIIGNKINECPKCNATGVTTAGGEIYKCDLCDGEGYSEKRYKPRMVQDGWEEITNGKE